MSNRFHSKFHRQNHHTYTSATNPDAGHDPIASPQQPFRGDFVLSGALSCYAGASATAGFFGTNNTALCALAGYRGIYVKSPIIGGEFLSTSGDALSAYGALIGGDFYSAIRGVRSHGTTYGVDTYSPNIALNANGNSVGGNFYSTSNAVSAYSPNIGLNVGSPNIAINAGSVGGVAVNAYSNTTSISSNGTNIGVFSYSPNVALSVSSPLTGASIKGDSISLLTNGSGVNILKNRTGLFKTPNASYGSYPLTNIVLDLNGDLFVDGNTLITGNLSALGALTQLDAHVQVTSSLKVNNIGNDAAVTIVQTGAQPILVCYDNDISLSVPSFIVDGNKNGWIALGTASPTAPLTIQKSTASTQGNNQPQIRISDDGTANRVSISTPITNYPRSYVGTESNTSFDIVTNATTQLTVSNTGNVGIGETSPGAKLAINGSLSGNSTFNLIGNATLNNSLNVSGGTVLSNTLNVSGGSTLNNLYVSGNLYDTGSLNILGGTVLSSTLNVSGGSTLNNLRVSSNTTLNDLYLSGNVNSSGTINTQRLSAYDFVLNHPTPNDGINPSIFMGEQGDGSVGTIAGSLSGFITLYDELQNKYVIKTQFGATTPLTALVIDQNANIGIGTNIPNVPLTVNGAISSTGNLTINGQINSGNLTVNGQISANGAITSINGFTAQDRISGSNYSVLYRSSDKTKLYDSVYGDVLYYDTSGQVGIGGIPTSGKRLSVSGDLYFTGEINGTLANSSNFNSASNTTTASPGQVAFNTTVSMQANSSYELTFNVIYTTSAGGQATFALSGNNTFNGSGFIAHTNAGGIATNAASGSLGGASITLSTNLLALAKPIASTPSTTQGANITFYVQTGSSATTANLVVWNSTAGTLAVKQGSYWKKTNLN